jgi:hypothetical protein
MRGVREGLRCMSWPKHSSPGAGQLTDGTCHLGKDVTVAGPRSYQACPSHMSSPDLAPHQAGARRRGARASPGPSPGQGPDTTSLK